MEYCFLPTKEEAEAYADQMRRAGKVNVCVSSQEAGDWLVSWNAEIGE